MLEASYYSDTTFYMFFILIHFLFNCLASLVASFGRFACISDSFLALCSPVYDEVISLCIDLRETDAAIAIVADMETTGIKVSDQILDKVLASRQGSEGSDPDRSEDYT